MHHLAKIQAFACCLLGSGAAIVTYEQEQDACDAIRKSHHPIQPHFTLMTQTPGTIALHSAVSPCHRSCPSTLCRPLPQCQPLRCPSVSRTGGLHSQDVEEQAGYYLLPTRLDDLSSAAPPPPVARQLHRRLPPRRRIVPPCSTIACQPGLSAQTHSSSPPPTRHLCLPSLTPGGDRRLLLLRLLLLLLLPRPTSPRRAAVAAGRRRGACPAPAHGARVPRRRVPATAFRRFIDHIRPPP